jgi:hypothetical protein
MVKKLFPIGLDPIEAFRIRHICRKNAFPAKAAKR